MPKINLLIFSKLLSKQQHYDWGLRSLRTILSGCSRNIRQLRKSIESAEAFSQEMELELVVKSLRMDTLSKLTYSDSIKFDILVQNIFPGISFETSGHEFLIAALEESFAELGIEVNNRQMRKCIELHEQLKQRMGVALVGPPSSGKSTIRNLLFHALSKKGKSLKQHIFNPKSMPRHKLLGQVDLDTRQWSDGVLTLCSLQATAEPLNVWSWIICDGDVDPEWIESLNSVLDDNKLLSLPSGWRIQFGPNINFIFETHDLSYASPATISRLGIVLLSEEDINLGNFVANFVSKQSEVSQGILGHYIQDYFFKSVDWICTEAELPIGSSKISVACTGLSQLKDITSKTQFTVKLISGIGGYLTYEEKGVFAQQIYEWTGEMQPSSIFCFYNKDRDSIETYPNSVNSYTAEILGDDLPLIMTAQVCFVMDCLRTWLIPGNEQHFLIVGPHGSAKSLIIEKLISERSDIEMVTIYCNANLSPDYLISKLTQCCMVVSSNKGRIYTPKKGHLVVHIKNMHLLRCDHWGTNMMTAFLQQLITYKGFFDSNLEWVGVKNVTLAGSLINLTDLSPRFVSIIHIFKISPPQPEDLNIIYTTYLSSLIKRSAINISKWSNNKTIKMATGMISIYNEVTTNYTNIQEQHYDFTPHDLTKWCKSIFRYKNENEADVEQFLLEALFYEAQRIFKDRLINLNECSKLDAILNSSLRNTWDKTSLLKALENNFYVPEPQFTVSRGTVSLSKTTIEEWDALLQRGIMLYEREGEDLNILNISEFSNLSARIAKTLTEPGGNILLIGRSGVGRRSSVKVVSALQSARLITPITANQPQLNNDLKKAMQFAGIDGEEVYLLLEDHIIEKETVIDIVNVMLCSGEVPGLYTPSEIDSLVIGLKDEASSANYEGNLCDFFIERIRKKLHIIVCLECNNSRLSKIFQDCPTLYQKCKVIWLSEWSKATMESMPERLTEVTNKSKTNKDNKIEITGGFLELHNLVKAEVATPFHFVLLIKTYCKLYINKRDVIANKQNKLELGVSKLTEARNIVAQLRMEAEEQQIKLAEKQAKANSALDMISNTMKNANMQKQEMEVLKQHTEKESLQLGKRKLEIEEELSEVQPLIDEARAAVGNIKTESLSEIRSLRAPPDIIRDILEGVLRLMGTQDTSWNSMKNFLSKRGVKEDIRSFDASRIAPENRQAVERLMTNRSESFDPKNAKRASVAAAPLAAWVVANVRFSTVLNKIKPLEREQNKLKQNLANAELQLEELSTGLSDVDTAVGKLKQQLSTYTKEAAEIEIHLRSAQDTLASAEGLVHKLNDEYERWQKQLKELSQELVFLPNNCLLAAAFITYLSGESDGERVNILSEWIKVLKINPSIYNFSLETFLSSEREQLQWQSEGLSADQLSLQNAVIILQSEICSLLLDPTSIASQWIKTHLKQRTVEIISQSSPKFNNALELAIRFGKFFIIEEIENISPVLFPILRKQFVYQGERKLININGKLIDYHSDFQLLMCSRNAHLKLATGIRTVVNVVNFVTTRTGLTEQLLTSAIKQESPDLEERRKELLRQHEELQEQQQNLQDQLLEDLANATGDILQNKNLITSLNETKASSNSITTALVESEKVQMKLQQEYNVYKDVSEFGSALYFAAKQFANVNVLYTLSVPAFIRFFLKSLPPVETIEHNLGFAQRSLIQALYGFMSRGIFKVDRLKFALHLCHNLLQRQIPEEEWNLFLGQSVATSQSDPARISENIPLWIPEHLVQNVYSIQLACPTLYNSLQLNNEVLWKNFMEKRDCETSFPTHCQLTEFQKVLVVQSLRFDRLHSTIIQCISHLTGLKSLNPEIIQLSAIFKETIAEEPILLMSSPGTDPSLEIKDLANIIMGKDDYIEIAMGEGQESKALVALNDASTIGQWLILKNLHLVISWLPTLCQNMQAQTFHKDFRLWLITEPHALFSSVLAQNSLKIAYEAPQGIKNNLLRIYSSWGAAYIEKLDSTSSRMFFVLACIYALLQERRTFIPLGWSKPYEFSDTDFLSAVKLTMELLQSQNTNVQWKFLIGLCSNAVYGGRIENIQDLVILDSYLRQYFVDEVLSQRWKPFGSMSYLPTYSNFEDYLNVIKQLSDRDLPSYFGLPENIDGAWERNVTLDMISKFRELSTIRNEPENIVREEWHKKLSPFLSLWKKLNQGHGYIKMAPLTPLKNGSSTTIFISEEYCFAIEIIHQIHKSFAILNKVTKGYIVPEDKDVTLANSLLCHQTPKVWQNIWKGPKDPNKYLVSVLQKVVIIEKWNSTQDVNTILRQPINLSHLFHPEAFLAAFKHDYSKNCGVPMDELKLETNWNRSTNNINVITVTGLLIEGGLFDGYALSPCLKYSDSVNAAPNCYLGWVQKENVLEHDKLLAVPLYYSLNREEILVNLNINCNSKDKDKWIQAGLALFIAH